MSIEKEIELTKLKKIVRQALSMLFFNDEHLLKYDVCEISIAHKLALYLGNFIKNYDIDIEYNRDFYDEDPKAVIGYFPKIEQLVARQAPQKYQDLADILFLDEELKNKVKQEKMKEYYEIEIVKCIEEKKNIRPDIIIHERGVKNNLLAIEIKKGTNSEDAFYDIIKLYYLRNQNQYQYKHAAFIQIVKDNDEYFSHLYWIYKNRNEIKFHSETFPQKYKNKRPKYKRNE